ncbi:MAG: malonyl-CoA decarboxylase, partial [Gammaproteobacteria bacterium]
MATSFLSDLLVSVAARGRSLLGIEAGIADVEGLVEQCEALVSWRGEATGMAIAQSVFECFERLRAGQRTEFFHALAARFGVDQEGLRSAIAAWQEEASEARAAALHGASEPRRQELLRRLNRAPHGTRRLVDMRASLLAALGSESGLEIADQDFTHLFSSWFNSGFLELRRIDWSTPAMLLDRIIRYEAVHEITDWAQLRCRIEPPDRRCYAFFHPALGDEPLIFVEVALTRSIPEAIAPVLAVERKPLAPDETDTAIFYSISNCQAGLRGISFGNFLIKQVVAEIAHELPQIRTFATLSPIPGFTRWLRTAAAAQADDPVLGSAAQTVLGQVAETAWDADEDRAKSLRAPLLSLAAHYFLAAKNGAGEPLDPVARFHLGNGARLDGINWLGDRAERGLAESLGLMANYVY